MEGISKLFDDKLAAFRETIMADIDVKIKDMVEKNTHNIASNSTTIEGHGLSIETMQDEINTLKEQMADREKDINTLNKQMIYRENEIDDLKNRSMRNNIVIKGIPYTADEEKNWDVTKTKVCQHIATLTNETVDDIWNKIDRCHRGDDQDDAKENGRNNRNNNNNKPRHIYANLYSSTEASFYVSKSSKLCVKEKNTSWSVDHQYSPKVQARRNAAMIHRRQLLNDKTIAQGRLVYPAKLLGKKHHKQLKWDLIKEFWYWYLYSETYIITEVQYGSPNHLTSNWSEPSLECFFYSNTVKFCGLLLTETTPSFLWKLLIKAHCFSIFFSHLLCLHALHAKYPSKTLMIL